MLMKHPEGLRVGHIARILYNNHCDLFSTTAETEFGNIYRSTRFYLWQQSRKKFSPFERKKWGIYALRNQFVMQLELVFDEWNEEMAISPPKSHTDKRDEKIQFVMKDLFETECVNTDSNK